MSIVKDLLGTNRPPMLKESDKGSFVTQLGNLKLAVLLPCHNEALSIARVVGGFRESLPVAQIYIVDNASTDETAPVAEASGAIVISEPLKGKGNAVRRAFADIDADIYVMADGDGTYDASRAAEMVGKLLCDRLDMVVGARNAIGSGAYRKGHKWGNGIFNNLMRSMFGEKFTDIFSGYRVFSRRFVKSFPALSHGFEIETEISVHAIHLRVPTAEVPIDYYERIDGSASKLRTYRDGVRILLMMIKLMKAVRPLAFFSSVAIAFLGLALALGMPVIWHFAEHGTVPRIPTTVAAAGLTILGAISFVTGLILDSVMLAETSYKRLFYLSLPATRHRTE